MTGLGVNQLAVSSPGNPGWQPAGWSSGCSAEPNYHCPPSTSLNVSTAGLPEGINNVSAAANTLSGHTLTQSVGQVKIDRTPPTASITPALAPFVRQTINVGGTAQDAASGWAQAASTHTATLN